MNKIKKVIIGLIVVLLVPSICSAEKITEKIGATETGITSFTSKIDRKHVKEAIIVSNYDFGSTAVYNSVGASAATSGWINVINYNDDIIFHVNLGTLGSTGIDVTFEGLLSDITSNILSIYTKSFSATDTGYRLPVAEGALKYVRVGGQATGTDGVDAATITARMEGAR